MRIAIREQLAALVIFAVLVSLAVISIPTWMFVNRFVVDIESKGMSLTASLKAAQINSELELLQTSIQTVATRRTIQDALIAFYRGDASALTPHEDDCENNPGLYWCQVTNDLGRALSTSQYTNLLQACIYLNDTYTDFEQGVLKLSSPSADNLYLPDSNGDGSNVTLADPEKGYPSALYPSMTNYTTIESTKTVESGNTTTEVSYNKTVAEPFVDVYITDSYGGLVLGPLVLNETLSLISLTGPIYDNGTSSDVLGYLTLVATAKSLVNIQKSSEGLDNSGVVLIIGPTEAYNRFPKDNPATTDQVKGDKQKLSSSDVHFILPPITPADGDDRHSERKFDSGDFDEAFLLSSYPAALNAFADSLGSVNNASSMLSTTNEEGYKVAVGYARPQTPLVNWTVIVEKSKEEAYVPVVTLRHILLGCVFGTAGVSLLIVYPAAHRFVMPIRRLKSATEKSIAPPGYADSYDSYDYDDGNASGAMSQKSKRGFFTNLKRMVRRKRRRSSATQDDDHERRRIFKIPARVEDRRHLVKDELTELTGTFNAMSDELYKQYTLLDEKVAERTKELEISKKAAEAANESKTLFIANISHELKTPLNGILGMTSICLDETDPVKIQESLKTIYKSGDLLLHLLTDLLNFSKNQIGQQLSLDQKEFRLNDIRQQIMVIFDKQVRENNIDFQVRFLSSIDDATSQTLDTSMIKPPALGPPGTGRLKNMCLWGDQHRILQVIINLVSNSLKFTPAGGKVDCRIKCLGEVDDPSDISRQSSTSRNGRSKTRNRVGSASNASGVSKSTAVDASSQFPVQEGTAVVINPAEPKVAPPVAAIRERSPSPPPRDTRTYLFEIEVQDTGPGIPEPMQQKVFEPFVQGDLGLSRKYGGTGLGLSICQQLATLMGGSISLTSTVGVGTTFTMRLPLKYIRDRPPSTASSRAPSLDVDRPPMRPSSPQTTPPSPTKQPAGGVAPLGEEEKEKAVSEKQESSNTPRAPADQLSKKPRLVGLSQPFFANADPSPASAKDDPIDTMSASSAVIAAGGKISDIMAAKTAAAGGADVAKLRVLVAEDNLTNIKVLSGFLEKEGMVNSVVFAKNGQEAYDRVKDNEDAPFDLILMDIQMPLMDGLQSAKLIRKDGYVMPIVALSAFSDESNVKQCMSVGMNDFIEKPLKRPTLKAMLQRFAAIPEEEEEDGSIGSGRSRPGMGRRSTTMDEKVSIARPGTGHSNSRIHEEAATNGEARDPEKQDHAHSHDKRVEDDEEGGRQTPEGGRTSSHSSHTIVTPSDASGSSPPRSSGLGQRAPNGPATIRPQVSSNVSDGETVKGMS
ncbi:hypothetical protein MKZ38_008532 [Zalerion maritima]|uniref:histidine kinase n=1 Tax=Zalerion maritima TaxID=339359 RepID=A0AAD5RW31_9PEZI|nr:hypothetical protein MKZ38_008532 [Zalerion maritima]